MFLLSSIHCSFCCIPKGRGERGRARMRLGLRFGQDSKQMCRELLGKVHRAVFEKPVLAAAALGPLRHHKVSELR